jgi:hypothetical protein
MRRISAVRGMTSGLKNGLREVARDNEEAVIGTQLQLRDKRLPCAGRQSLRDANRTASIWFRRWRNNFDATIVNGI